MCPCQESGVYTFMNLLPLTSIIEGGGSQGPSPLTGSMIFLLRHRLYWKNSGGKKMHRKPCNSHKLAKTSCWSVGAHRKILFLTFLSSSVIKKDSPSPGFVGWWHRPVWGFKRRLLVLARAALNFEAAALSSRITDAWLSECSLWSKVVHAECR